MLQLKIIALMIRYLLLATLLLAAAAALYLYSTWPPSPTADAIFIETTPPATVVLEIESQNYER